MTNMNCIMMWLGTWLFCNMRIAHVLLTSAIEVTLMAESIFILQALCCISGLKKTPTNHPISVLNFYASRLRWVPSTITHSPALMQKSMNSPLKYFYQQAGDWIQKKVT